MENNYTKNKIHKWFKFAIKVWAVVIVIISFSFGHGDYIFAAIPLFFIYNLKKGPRLIPYIFSGWITQLCASDLPISLQSIIFIFFLIYSLLYFNFDEMIYESFSNSINLKEKRKKTKKNKQVTSLDAFGEMKELTLKYDKTSQCLHEKRFDDISTILNSYVKNSQLSPDLFVKLSEPFFKSAPILLELTENYIDLNHQLDSDTINSLLKKSTSAMDKHIEYLKKSLDKSLNEYYSEVIDVADELGSTYNKQDK